MRRLLSPVFLTILISLTSLLNFAHAAETPARAAKADAPIVFVCEYGTAKSVIAALHFNKIAEQRGLPYRALSRGINAETKIHGPTQLGLSQDGIDTKDFVGSSLTAEIANNARRVVTIGLENPPEFVKQSKPLEWNKVPSVGKDYAKARDHMLQNIEALLQELASAK